ncbi:MAG: zinc ribbon domain-containing protein, partial [Ignavibacteriaceae bacterium]|nr:zinc ribbon domain-containing protein [Ignavibacteriaceae bacterium]
MSDEFELTSEEDGSSFPRGNKTSDIKTAIIDVTKKGNLRISKDEVWQYWHVLKSADFFERLFLDIDNSALITNEVISYHYEEIRSYLEKWKERESAGINFAQSHGGYPLRELERNLEEAYLNLKNRASREEYLNSYSEEKKKQAVKSLEPIIKMALADKILTYDEKTLIYQEGLKFGLNIRDIDNLIDLQKRIIGEVTDETNNVAVNAADKDPENKKDPDLFCPNCKVKIDPDAAFCGECGIKIAPDSELKPIAEEIASNSYERPSPADVSERNGGALSGSADKEDPGHIFSFYFRRFFPSVVLLHYLIFILDTGISFSAMGNVLQRLFFVDSFLIAFSIFTGRKLKDQHPEAYRITKFFLITLILFSLFPGNYNFKYLQRYMHYIFGWDAGVAELKFVWSILSVLLYGFIYRKFTKSPAIANLYNTGKDSAANIVNDKLKEDNNFL